MNKTCFVVIGFGPKTDFRTGRVIDLDKTYENLIKPVFDKLDIECFRAKEIKHSGIIDVPMYEWLLNADIVVADISTLNPNALYELGVRHALRPNTTVVISEDQLEYPFDVNHTVIESYEHLGKDIGVTEANRFKTELENKVLEIIDKNSTDSPVYTYIPNLLPPSLAEKKDEENNEADEIKPSVAKFSELLEDAEKLKNEGQFDVAKDLYLACLDFEPNSDFLLQRLALVTYKSQSPTKVEALKNAEKILAKLNPSETTDPETLGLSGAIQKRLFESTSDENSLDLSMMYYEKGFVLLNDYYNGFNYAYLLFVKSKFQKVDSKQFEYKAAAHLIFERVLNICTTLLNDENAGDRDDLLWIHQTLCLCYLALEQRELYEQERKKVVFLSKGDFDIETFEEHENKLIELTA
jgi:hypothetical protein